MRFNARFAISGLVLTLASIVACSKSSKAPTAVVTPPNPVCALSTSALSFGEVPLGETADLQFTLTNSGTGTLSGAVTDTSSVFSLVNSATYSLGPGQVATFTVRFTSLLVGNASCTLQTGSVQCGAVTCTATGQTVTPLCSIPSSSLLFGNVPIGGQRQISFDIQNVGHGIMSGTATGAGVDFTVIDPDFSLSAGEYHTFGVRYRPSTNVAEACTLSLGASGCAEVICQGGGYLETHDYCSVAVTSGVVDFGEVSVGHTAERTVTLKNFSDGYLARGAVDDYCPDFTDLIGGYTIDPGTSITGTVQFTPSRTGAQSCVMPLDCWMDGSGTNQGIQSAIHCVGVGVGGDPVCQLSTTSLDFGTVAIGETKDLPLVVTNLGTGPLSGIAGPSHCPEFTFLEPTTYNLGLGQSTTLMLRYTPLQAGHTTTCSLMPIGLECQAVSAVGAAVGPPACDISTTSLDFGSVPVGQSKDLTFDIHNSGGGTLCGAVTEGSADFAIIQNSSYCITSPAFVRVTVRFTPSAVGQQLITISAGPGVTCPTIYARGIGI